MLVFLTPTLVLKAGDWGITAGSGIKGAGETERREEPNDDRRLWVDGGGCIGKGRQTGVPGAEGAGDPTELSAANDGLPLASGGAGLEFDIRRAGRSILAIFPCEASENWPSLLLNV